MSRNIDTWESTEEQEGEEILLSAMELSEMIEQRLKRTKAVVLTYIT
jgi:hypothetical protein